MNEGAVTGSQIRAAIKDGHELKLTTGGDGLTELAAQSLEEAVREVGEKARGLRVRGASIVGHLDLSQTALPAGMEFVNCHMPNGLSIVGSDLSSLRFEDTCVAHIDARGVAVRRPVELHYVFRGEQDAGRLVLNLRNARIGGLELESAALEYVDLSASTIAGQVTVTDSKLLGTVMLVDTDISGHLWFRSCEFASDSDWHAIYARGLRVGGSLRFLAGCRANAGIQFYEVSIDGSVDIYGGQFTDNSLALSITDSNISGSVSINKAWEMSGDISDRKDRERANELASAYEANIASLRPDGHHETLDAGLTYYDGPLFAGSVQFARTNIAGDLDIGRCETNANAPNQALILSGASVGGTLSISGAHRHFGGIDMSGIKVRDGVALDLASVHGPVDLTGADVTGVVRIACWDVSGPLVLDRLRATTLDVDPAQLVPVSASFGGIAFQQLRLHTEPVTEVKQWVRALDDLDHGDAGYEAVASALDAAGHHDLAIRLRIARYRRAQPQGRGGRVSHWLYGAFLSYGFRPSRMIIVVLGLIGAVALLTTLPAADGALATTSKDGTTVHTKESPCTTEVHCFDSVLFAVDTVAPLVDVGQRSHWDADRSAPWGRELSYALSAARLAGWAATTIFVIALSRAARDR